MGRTRVLLVDDHTVVREALRAMLGTEPDIQVIAEAGDGLEAVQKVAEHKPDVILMDVRMPNMDGLEAARRIKAEFPSIAIIMLTVYDDDAYIIDAVRAGASAYLLKDASRDLLVHAIRAASSGGIVLRSRLIRQAVAGLLGPEAAQVREGRHRGFEELGPRDALMLVAEGRTNKEIGEALLISEDTAKTHIRSIIDKLGVADRTQAAVKAVRAGHQPEVGDTFAEDVKYYKENLSKFLAAYKGKYIALLNKQIVDSDTDFSQLAKRVYAKFGYRDIFMPKVERKPRTLRAPSPRIYRA